MCADGVTRVIMFDAWYWKKLDVILNAEGAHTLDEITRICLDLAQRTLDEKGQDFEEAFYELFMYYIYLNYKGYLQYRHGIANTFWEDVHQRERSWPITLARSSD